MINHFKIFRLRNQGTRKDIESLIDNINQVNKNSIFIETNRKEAIDTQDRQFSLARVEIEFGEKTLTNY